MIIKSFGLVKKYSDGLQSIAAIMMLSTALYSYVTKFFVGCYNVTVKVICLVSIELKGVE